MLMKQDIDIHKRRFITLTTVIFALIAVGHSIRIMQGWSLKIGYIALPMSVSYLAVLLALCMCVMGIYYLHK